ncbi:MAG: hypothetical protein ACXVKA_05695 [Acidimicrobiia bacterium]
MRSQVASGSGDRHSTWSNTAIAGFLAAVIALAAAAMVSGVVHRITEGWQPQGDDAAIAWLTRDVFSAHSPLLGMPSTVGGSTSHHWGPLLFWVFAIPQKLAGQDPVGLQIGLLLLELAAVTGIGVFAYRRAGRLGALLMLVLLATVEWSLGRQTLSSIWNPSAALLPLACLFVLVWSAADGDRIALPFLAFAASFVAQCNLLYTPLVAALVGWAILGFVLTTRQHQRDGSGPSRAQLRRAILISGIVLLVCWSAPLISEIVDRPGNIEQVLQNGTGETGEHVGIVRTFHVLTHALGIVPFWSHPMSSLSDIFDLTSAPSLTTAVTAIGVVLLLLGGLVWTWRGETQLRALLGTAVAGLGGSVIVVVRLPVAFGVAPYRLWSLWVTGMFAWFAVLVLGATLLSRRFAPSTGAPTRQRIVRAATVALIGALGALAIVGATGSTPAFLREQDSSAAVRRLVQQARHDLPAPGPYLVEQRALTVGSGVLWGLARHGYDLRVSKRSAPLDGVYLADHHGPNGAKLARLVIVNNLSPYAGTHLGRPVASTTVGATPTQRRTYARAVASACRVLQRKPPPITTAGNRFLQHHPRDPDARALTAYASTGDPCGLAEYRLLQRLTDRKAIRLDRAQQAELSVLALAEQINQPHKYSIYLQRP